MNKNESKYFNTALKMNDALISLLDKKSFEYITVKDICEVAKVNRSTFYLHYSNTVDVLDEVVERLNDSFNNHLKTNDTQESIINKIDLDELYLINDDYLIPYLAFIKENKNIYKALRNNPDVFKANRTYENMYKSVFSPIMSRFGLDQKWHKYLMDFYMNGISSVIIDWVNDDCVIDIQEVSEFIKGLVVNYDKKNN
ncbi:MAG: TetR family transcriptional regulator C-terminal domain-containing protein [Bacilli bacterium]|nr:TetR family transcriptional regulator C-terminal domain-containing protein [Bacilli bacterium]